LKGIAFARVPFIVAAALIFVYVSKIGEIIITWILSATQARQQILPTYDRHSMGGRPLQPKIIALYVQVQEEWQGLLENIGVPPHQVHHRDPHLPQAG
jgi:hypothetical protein